MGLTGLRFRGSIRLPPSLELHPQVDLPTQRLRSVVFLPYRVRTEEGRPIWR